MSKYLVPSLLVVNILLVWNPSPTESNGDFILPQLRREVYARPGDINIGVILGLHTKTDESGCAGDIYPGSWAIEIPESVPFAVEMVNNNPNLVPKATLGFYMLDDCSDRRYAMTHALTFMPLNEQLCTQKTCNTTESSNVTCIPTTCTVKQLTNVSSLSSAYKEQPVPYYDVVGVLAPQKSTLAIPVSLLLSLAKMPIVGYMTSSEDLADKTLHPTFLKMVTSDRHQVNAMLKFISANGWSYISVVYSNGLYGEGAFSIIKDSVGSYNTCIASSHRVKDGDDMAPVAIDLLHHPGARVVILYTNVHQTLNLFRVIEIFDMTGRFIWICCDNIALAGREPLSRYIGSVVGAFMFAYNTVQVPEFHEYIRRQNAMTSSNPWFKLAWEKTFKCLFRRGTCNAKADITKNLHFGFEGPPSLIMDAVLIFAHGIHALLADLCPGATGKAARDCIKRDILLDYLLKVSFDGYTGRIVFDKNKEYHGQFIINQMTYDYLVVPDKHGKSKMTNWKGLVGKKVAHFDSRTNILSFTDQNISWDHLVKVKRIVPLLTNTSNVDLPESVCSRPCLPGEYKIQKDLACCWECRKCGSNEKLVNDKTACEACGKFTWPDPETDFTTCRNIPLSYLIITEMLPLFEICLAVLGITGTFLVAAAYIYYRNTRVMKAASRELSAFQLSGILVGYATVILLQTTPTPVVCTTLYFIFCLSFSWLYSPLLIKAIRIYRIFQNGKKGRKPRFISPWSQVFMTTGLIIFQVVLCLVIYIVYRPTAVKSHPIPTEKLVELSCDMTLPGLVSFLAYNLVLVSLCAVFAFKTRKLPSNFKESKLISMCVYTTLVIWLAFIPTYFTANRQFVQVLLLSAALLLNHTVALLFLFVPKIYASMYVADEDIITEKIRTMATLMHSAVLQPSPVVLSNNNTDERILTRRSHASAVGIGRIPRERESLNNCAAKSVADGKATYIMDFVQSLFQAVFRTTSALSGANTAQKQLSKQEISDLITQMKTTGSPLKLHLLSESSNEEPEKNTEL